MATALDQQEQFQRILAQSLAPVYSYNQGLVNQAALGDQQRQQMNLLNVQQAGALEREKIQANAHIEGIKAQAAATFDRLGKAQREQELRKLGLVVPRKPGESDDEFYERATASLPLILGAHDAKVQTLQAKNAVIATAAEASKFKSASRAAFDAALNTIGDPKLQAQLRAAQASTPEQVQSALDAARVRAHWYSLSPSELPESVKQGFLSAYDMAFEKAIAKPQYPESLIRQSQDIERELQQALRGREAFTTQYPSSMLLSPTATAVAAREVAQQPNPLRAAVDSVLERTSANLGRVNQGISKAANEQARLNSLAAPEVNRAPGVIPSFVNTIGSNLAPGVQGVVSPATRSLSNLAAYLFGGNYKPVFDPNLFPGAGVSLPNNTPPDIQRLQQNLYAYPPQFQQPALGPSPAPSPVPLDLMNSLSPAYALPQMNNPLPPELLQPY